MWRGRSILGILAVTGLGAVLSACGGSSPTALSQTVTLQAVPDGIVALNMGSQPGLTAQLWGLQPGDRYRLALIQGTCLAPGVEITALGRSAADLSGRLEGTFPAGTVPSHLPSAVSVTLAEDTGSPTPTPVGCTQLSSTRPTAAQRMFPVPTARGSGTVILAEQSGHLTVDASARGMAANSRHLVRVVLGTCNAEGSTSYDVGVLAANASGTGSLHAAVTESGRTVVKGWSVVLYALPSSATAGQHPVLCGNVAAF
ncbi:MAG TPA: hypothetical protein VFA16_17885 [Mycobacterium sp.]|uniref:hypothetical protein n=1 Tax=Mycobacterium sp. TaxID=1785 RepID=UPI002D2A83DA|nr:hypothetical protein [Mycobacterium sp.]HZU49102.1 hypothetical protein [Mycobacterium sp.]